MLRNPEARSRVGRAPDTLWQPGGGVLPTVPQTSMPPHGHANASAMPLTSTAGMAYGCSGPRGGLLSSTALLRACVRQGPYVIGVGPWCPPCLVDHRIC